MGEVLELARKADRLQDQLEILTRDLAGLRGELRQLQLRTHAPSARSPQEGTEPPARVGPAVSPEAEILEDPGPLRVEVCPTQKVVMRFVARGKKPLSEVGQAED